MNNLISVIIPVHNSEQYLEKCINSILEQRYTDFEIILINDGSKDRSGDICDLYVKNDARVQVIHSENRGVSVARNKGLEVATGKYIFFLDSDDYVDQDKFNSLYTILKKENIDFLASGFSRVSNERKIFVNEKNSSRVTNSEELCCDLIHWRFKVCMGSFFVESTIAKSIKFDENTKYGEDLEYIYKCILNSKNIKVTEGILLNYRQHNVSTITKISVDRFDVFFSRQRIREYIKLYYADYEKLLIEMETFSLPEAIVQTLNLLCYYGEPYKKINSFMIKNGIDTFIKKNYLNEKINIAFLDVIKEWNDYPKKYYRKQRKKYYIYTCKHLLYSLYRGEKNV